LFPTPSEEQELLDESAQHRWYYNAYLDIFDLDAHMKTVNDAKAAEEDFAPSVNWQTLQERLKDYEYVEEIGTRMKVCSLRVREGAAEARQDKDAKVTLEKERKKQIAKDKKCKEKAEQELIESVMSKEQVKEHRARLRDERATLRAAAKEQKSRERAERKAAEQNMTKQQIKKYRSELRAAKLAASGKTAPIPKPRNMAKYPMPDWMEDRKVYERVIRGAAANFASNLNSATSNYFNENNEGFSLNWKTARDKHEYIHFTDGSYPAHHKDYKGAFFYKSSGPVRRAKMLWRDLVKLHPDTGFTIVQDKQTKIWYAYLPVEQDWYPPSDVRSENQRTSVRGEAVGLDPGMRKFLTGFSTTGESLFFGDRAYRKLIPLHKTIRELEVKLALARKGQLALSDTEKRAAHKTKQTLWARVKNLVKEMHWKCIAYLVTHYQYIFLGNFKVKDCVQSKKGKKDLSALIKRILLQFSFYQFKQRLEYACERYGCKLILVHEALTSKTCSCCGHRQDIGSSEEYKCPNCKSCLDRDVNSARNILIKGMTQLESRVRLTR